MHRNLTQTRKRARRDVRAQVCELEASRSTREFEEDKRSKINDCKNEKDSARAGNGHSLVHITHHAPTLRAQTLFLARAGHRDSFRHEDHQSNLVGAQHGSGWREAAE